MTIAGGLGCPTESARKWLAPATGGPSVRTVHHKSPRRMVGGSWRRSPSRV